MRRSRWLVLLFVALGACGGGLDIWSVVQETNTPNGPCDGVPYQYTRDITPTCGTMPFGLLVCASEPLCAAQVDGIAAKYTACDPIPPKWRAEDLPMCPAP
jgi:hypothetical protein